MFIKKYVWAADYLIGIKCIAMYKESRDNRTSLKSLN